MSQAHGIQLDFRARPSALAFMSRAVRPSPGFRHGVPAIAARWHHQPQAEEITRFHALSGLQEGEALPLLYPQTIAFPLQMAILTQPAFPLPIWRMLQIRNRIVQHARLERDEALDIEARIVGHRLLDKGAEFDMQVDVLQRGRCVWECLNTFYTRGRFGAAQAQAIPAAPKVSAGRTAHWRMVEGGGWRFGGLSGDYNPLHLWRGYAKKRGYAGAFLHPQRVLGECLARLSVDQYRPLQLEAWIKGPVFYGAPVELLSEACDTQFALHVNDDTRPAFVGRLSEPAPLKPPDLTRKP